jgi:hypothetical protein
LAEKYGKTAVAIQNYFQELRRRDFQVVGLSLEEREKIKEAKLKLGEG